MYKQTAIFGLLASIIFIFGCEKPQVPNWNFLIAEALHESIELAKHSKSNILFKSDTIYVRIKPFMELNDFENKQILPSIIPTHLGKYEIKPFNPNILKDSSNLFIDISIRQEKNICVIDVGLPQAIIDSSRILIDQEIISTRFEYIGMNWNKVSTEKYWGGIGLSTSSLQRKTTK